MTIERIRKFKIGEGKRSTSPRNGQVTEDQANQMIVVIRTVAVAAILGAMTWAASTLLSTSVTTAEIQKDLLNVDRATQKELLLLNQRIQELRIEFRDYKNEQRSQQPSQSPYGWRGIPHPSNPPRLDPEPPGSNPGGGG